MRLTQLGADGLAPYDVVIAGTSFAALPVAIALGARGRVLLVEGGDFDERDDARSLTANDEYGHFSDGHWASHWIRAVGGTSRRWSGVVAALDASDFRGGRGRPRLADHARRSRACLSPRGGVAGPSRGRRARPACPSATCSWPARCPTTHPCDCPTPCRG